MDPALQLPYLRGKSRALHWINDPPRDRRRSHRRASWRRSWAGNDYDQGAPSSGNSATGVGYRLPMTVTLSAADPSTGPDRPRLVPVCGHNYDQGHGPLRGHHHRGQVRRPGAQRGVPPALGHRDRRRHRRRPLESRVNVVLVPAWVSPRPSHDHPIRRVHRRRPRHQDQRPVMIKRAAVRCHVTLPCWGQYTASTQEVR